MPIPGGHLGLDLEGFGAGSRDGTRGSWGSRSAVASVSAYGEASNATGIGGDQADNSSSNSGAVYLY